MPRFRGAGRLRLVVEEAPRLPRPTRMLQLPQRLEGVRTMVLLRQRRGASSLRHRRAPLQREAARIPAVRLGWLPMWEQRRLVPARRLEVEAMQVCPARRRIALGRRRRAPASRREREGGYTKRGHVHRRCAPLRSHLAWLSGRSSLGSGRIWPHRAVQGCTARCLDADTPAVK